jgi:uncharacterized repeat protein (TIGR01451 family)
LNIASAAPVIPGADLSVSVTDSPDPVPPGGIFTYTIAVTNHGPAAATSVMLTNLLPVGANLISFTGPGSFTQNGNALFASVGSIPIGGGVIVTVTMGVPIANVLLTLDSAVGAGQLDLNPGNNRVSIKTTVSDAAAAVPALFAARKNADLVLSWQGTSTNIVLQSSTLMDSGSWSTMGDPPVVSNGVSTVTVPTTGNTKFFRLRRIP